MSFYYLYPDALSYMAAFEHSLTSIYSKPVLNTKTIVMPNLQITARHRVHHGKLDEFKKATEQCLSLVKEKDKDTLQFDCYFSEDQSECVFRETYPDSNALIAHIGNIGEAFGKQLQLADFEAEIYGSPSQELLNAIAGLKVKIYSPFQAK